MHIFVKSKVSNKYFRTYCHKLKQLRRKNMSVKQKIFKTDQNSKPMHSVQKHKCIQLEAVSCNVLKVMGINVKIQIWPANKEYSWFLQNIWCVYSCYIGTCICITWHMWSQNCSLYHHTCMQMVFVLTKPAIKVKHSLFIGSPTCYYHIIMQHA